MKEVGRRTGGVGSFPGGNSSLMLVAARLSRIEGIRCGTRKYLNMNGLIEQDREEEAAGQSAV